MDIIKLNKLDQVKQEHVEKLKIYDNLVITHETTTEIAKVRANINKDRMALERERKDLNKAVNDAYKQIVVLYDEKLTYIDTELDALDDERKIAVRHEIELKFASYEVDFALDEIFDERWLNKTSKWETELELAVLKKKHQEPEKPKVIVTSLLLDDVTDEQLAKIEALLNELKVKYQVR